MAEIAADREREQKAAVAVLRHEVHTLVGEVKARAADLERKREREAKTFADDAIVITAAERCAALKSERAAIEAELIELTGIDPIAQDKKARAFLLEHGMLDDPNMSEECEGPSKLCRPISDGTQR